MTRTRLLAALGLLLLGGLSLPVINLVVGLPQGVELGAAGEGAKGYLEARGALAEKCSNCHTSKAKLPFYASLPPAKSLIEADIRRGTAFLDLEAEFSQAPGEPIREVTLAKLEHALSTGSMPPVKYLALHWDGGLLRSESLAVSNWIRAERSAHYASPALSKEGRDQILQPLPNPPALAPDRVALGKKLYHDVRLSGDGTISCASCHGLDKGGTDQAQFSTGVGGAVGGINSPTVFNAGLQLAQFWDGRAADLKAQAAGPVTNPIEMAAQWPQVIETLSQDQALKSEFLAAYPGGFSMDSITDAIATYEETLLTPDSDFDRFLKGDAKALSPEASAGHEIFNSTGCATCHVGMAMGGQSYEKMGRYGDYFADRGQPTDADLGRFSVTKKEADRHCFKVPTLRNIALTGPYFHDGSVLTLEDACQKMVQYQFGTSLTQSGKKSLVAFLKSLTGKLEGKKLS